MRSAALVLAFMFLWWFIPNSSSYRVGPYANWSDCNAAREYYGKNGVFGSCQFMSD